MKISELCTEVLSSGALASKLISFDDFILDEKIDFQVPDFPMRDKRIQRSEKQLKFPKGNYHEKQRAAHALHCFANHELLAIEMMACALLYYPHNTEAAKKAKLGIIQSLKDEQKHFKLYQTRIEELGYEFGDFPINDFFWGNMKNLKTLEQYFACLSLTFEAANLDFASFYEQEFRKIEDFKTADILKIVLKDEISHVGLGVFYLNQWKKDKTLWQYYQENLVAPLSPSRSKGQFLNKEARLKANFDIDYIEKLSHFDDGFRVTKRKTWK